jgi:hypothetical protein
MNWQAVPEFKSQHLLRELRSSSAYRNGWMDTIAVSSTDTNTEPNKDNLDLFQRCPEF